MYLGMVTKQTNAYKCSRLYYIIRTVCLYAPTFFGRPCGHSHGDALLSYITKVLEPMHKCKFMCLISVQRGLPTKKHQYYFTLYVSY